MTDKTTLNERALEAAENAVVMQMGSDDNHEWDIAFAAVVAYLTALPPTAVGGAEPVAWRVKDFADGWIYCPTEELARSLSEQQSGALVQPLYAHPPEQGWQPIETAPSDGRLILIAWADRHPGVECRAADGDWWRSPCSAPPDCWMPLPPPPAQGGSE